MTFDLLDRNRQDGDVERLLRALRERKTIARTPAANAPKKV